MPSTSHLRFDASSLFLPHGDLPSDVVRLYVDRLASARARISAMRKSREQGFMSLPFDTAMLKRVKAMAVATQRFETLLVLGIGGSDLGARAILQALPQKRRVIFAGANTDPDELASILSSVNLKKTCVNIISKSGDTIEPMSAFLIIRERLKKAVGRAFASQIVATTDESKGTLRKWATKEGYRTLIVPNNVGGRFSVLSDVGLFPAAWAGASIKDLLAGAARQVKSFERDAFEDQPSAVYAATHAEAFLKHGRYIFVLMPYASRLESFAKWYRQLIAESLGKSTTIGPTPIAALGATDQHSQLQLYMEGPQDKMISFLEIDSFGTKMHVPRPPFAAEKLKGIERTSLQDLIHAERRFTSEALTHNERPNATFFLSKLDAQRLGQLFQCFMQATAYLGELLRVNTYDQPGVEEGKKRFHAWLRGDGAS